LNQLWDNCTDGVFMLLLRGLTDSHSVNNLYNLNVIALDLFAKLQTNLGPLGKHSELAEGYFAFPKLEGEIAPRMKFRGKTVLTWSLNNYLGLANHPEVRKADTDAAAK